MEKIAKIEKRPDLVKDLNTVSVINIDTARYLEHKKFMAISRKNAAEKNAMSESIVSLNGEINNLKNEMDSIKQMLQILIDRKE
jgi:predicted transcriptional regulator